MSTAIVQSKVPDQRGRALILTEALEQESVQRGLLGQYVRDHMTEGTDYGVIPGTEKKDAGGNVIGGVKTLLKPGAEKLCQLFRCTPRYTIEDKVENWETGFFHYRFTCRIVSNVDDTIVAEGVGSCSTYESRYRWRTQDRKCPECGKEAIKRSKFPPKGQPDAEPGWYCYAKIGGCGANFDFDDTDIVGQVVGRVQNPDLIDQVNTVLKMAKKRALVDAAIALARCSDIFTQDLDELVEDGLRAEGQQRPDPTPAPSAAPTPATGATVTKPSPGSRSTAPATDAPALRRAELAAAFAGARTHDEYLAVCNQIGADYRAKLITEQDRLALREVAAATLERVESAAQQGVGT